MTLLNDIITAGVLVFVVGFGLISVCALGYKFYKDEIKSNIKKPMAVCNK